MAPFGRSLSQAETFLYILLHSAVIHIAIGQVGHCNDIPAFDRQKKTLHRLPVARFASIAMEVAKSKRRLGIVVLRLRRLLIPLERLLLVLFRASPVEVGFRNEQLLSSGSEQMG